MIEIVHRNADPQSGQRCPALVCDACRKQIIGAGNVNYVHRGHSGEPREQSPLLLSHKGRCTQVLDAMISRTYPESEGWVTSWQEAKEFMKYLIGNVDQSLDELDTEILPYAISARPIR